MRGCGRKMSQQINIPTIVREVLRHRLKHRWFQSFYGIVDNKKKTITPWFYTKWNYWFLKQNLRRGTYECRFFHHHWILVGRLHRWRSPACCYSSLQGNKAERRTHLYLLCMYALKTQETPSGMQWEYSTTKNYYILQINHAKIGVLPLLSTPCILCVCIYVYIL